MCDGRATIKNKGYLLIGQRKNDESNPHRRGRELLFSQIKRKSFGGDLLLSSTNKTRIALLASFLESDTAFASTFERPGTVLGAFAGTPLPSGNEMEKHAPPVALFVTQI